MTLPALTPAVLGARLRAKLLWLAEGYAPMAASEDLKTWLAWPLTRWQRLWAGMEQAQVLEVAGRAAGAKGCPFGKTDCPPESPWVCRACGQPPTPVQEKML